MTNLLALLGYASLVVAAGLFHPALGVAVFGAECLFVAWFTGAPDEAA